MSLTSPTNYQELVEQFINRTLPAKHWTHEAHLIVALYFLNTYPTLEATYYLKTGIISYHSSQGGKHTLTRGYHETLTLFWVWAIEAFLNEADNRALQLQEQVERLLESNWSSKTLPYLFFTKAQLQDLKARVHWVEPDRRPLDALVVRQMEEA